jgi:acetylornithine deacetylase/succinyl-diaminopimelate desuccinylase-like protein
MKKRSDELMLTLKDKRSKWIDAINSTREMVLSNLAMISQVPAVPFEEERRSALLMERFLACGIQEPQADTVHNVIGTIPGRTGEKRILLFAHMDHMTDMAIDQGITISKDRVLGRGVPEDTMALATLITMPDVINRVGLQLDSDVVIVAATRYHGRGDQGGIRQFMRKRHAEIDYCINLVGIPLGTLNYFSLSRTRGDINCQIDLEPDSPWGRVTNTSAIIAVSEIINEIYRIPLPRQPKTVINIGMISGGERYSTISTEAEVKLEVLSEDDAYMERVLEEIRDRCMDVAARYDVIVKSEFFGRYRAAGLSYSHPLVKSAVKIINYLGYRPMMTYNHWELAIPLSYSIPSISLGITTGNLSRGSRGSVNIKPIPTGMLQLLMLLIAIDKGYCDEKRK